MENQPEIYEYELIDICFQPEYELQEEDAVGLVCEDEPINDADTTQIEYDADGIPMGTTREEYEIRQKIITDFLQKWGKANSERKILNDALGDYIFIKGVSVIEAKEHTAKRYKSTRAIMILDEVLKNAKPVARVPTKKGNKNQEPFAYVLIMVYRHKEIGIIKLTVGVKASPQYIQYGITAVETGQPLIDNSVNRQAKTKKRRSRK